MQNADNVMKQKFTEWKECLEGKNPPLIDPNSISGVLHSLFWEMGAYESYVAICKSNPKSPFTTPLFGKLTAYNYIQVQAIRIRRLCEPLSAQATGKDTSIYSLRRIVDEIKQERKAGRLTRENMCIAYDIPSSKSEVERQFNKDTSGISGSFSTSSVAALKVHSMLDNVFDKHGNFKKSLLTEIDKRLLIENNVQLNEIINFVNKSITHSASDNSRKQVDGNLELKVANMKKVIQDITEAFFCCNMLISQADYAGMIPVGWQDQLSGISKEEAGLVYEVFEGIDKDCMSWKKNGYVLLGEDVET